MMRKIKTVLLILAAMVMASPVCARDLVVGVEEQEYYPLFAVREGDYVGTAREILDAFAHAQGHRLIYRPLPIDRLFSELVSGRIDLKFPDNAQWGGDFKAGRSIAYSKPVVASLDGVMVRPMNLGRGASAIRVLGTVSGFQPLGWKDRIADGSVALRAQTGVEDLLKQAATGKVDGAYVSVAVANYALARLLDMDGALVFDASLPHIRGSYHLSSFTQPEIIRAFDQWLMENAALVESVKLRMNAEKGIK
ncbi:substrate-binding periplasmic protein [Magnetospirillum sulfuroxidans]|uniref:Solute-binding protein family 3/N-terminal domain-containing protein n=1 Tax=Magnetospirillum sulfuroxidans TaxID=611300 RepID=A0ABS5IBH1_9PROT|nr:hypothetical protein [Magnetospirillum sulfuroxidans]MBR9971777.1 hypothetical protein [Magnetospirillum sulfuroxidans]